jgi:hypothetical protein
MPVLHACATLHAGIGCFCLFAGLSAVACHKNTISLCQLMPRGAQTRAVLLPCCCCCCAGRTSLLTALKPTFQSFEAVAAAAGAEHVDEGTQHVVARNIDSTARALVIILVEHLPLLQLHGAFAHLPRRRLPISLPVHGHCSCRRG